MSSKAFSKTLKSFFQLGRPFTSFLGSLGVLAAGVAATGIQVYHFIGPMLQAMLLVFVFTMGANALNDYVDRDIDITNHPERPIPSMKVKPKSALFFSEILFFFSALISVVLSTIAGVGVFALFLGAFIFQVLYEYRAKRIKYLGNYLIALLTVMAFLLGGVVVNSIFVPAIFASTAFLAILAREIIKDVEDLEGDINRKSLPKIIGIRQANVLACFLLITAIIISIIAYYPLKLLGTSYLFLITFTDAFFLICIPIIFKNSNRARRILKVAMFLALLSFVLGGLLP
jgi:geranylgeranylglycerol-phosphate geranylgeranyltransferase